MTTPARFAAALTAFSSQYWLQKMRWDEPEHAAGKCVEATECLLSYMENLGFQDLAWSKLLGSKTFDPGSGTVEGTRHFHVVARIGTVYVDLTARQYRTEEDSPWPLVMSLEEIDSRWAQRADLPYIRGKGIDWEWGEIDV